MKYVHHPDSAHPENIQGSFFKPKELTVHLAGHEEGKSDLTGGN
jgi:hypothetical protein